MTNETNPAETTNPEAQISIDAANVIHASSDLRKDAENTAKQHINAIWQKLENAAEWPIEKIEALIADLKKHL